MAPMGRAAIAVSVAVWMPLAAGSPAEAQSRERRMYVSVLDADERPVADLSVNDFTVREDGVLREILRVGPAVDPLHVALLVDNSSAIAPHLRDLRDGLEAFVDRVGADGAHGVAVITFGDRPTIVEDYTRSLIEMRRAVGRIFPRPSSGALMLDAIYNAGQGMRRLDASRPVFVAVTAEGVEYSSRSYQQVLVTVRDAGATLYAVVMTAAGASMETGGRFRDIVLDRGTLETGGRRIDLLHGQRFRESMEGLADEILSQYLLVYARPDMLVPPDSIEVGTTRPALSARGRSVREVR